METNKTEFGPYPAFLLHFSDLNTIQNMPQSVLIQIGQCGNQIGYRFWNLLLKEYAAHQENLNNDALEYFFKSKKDSIGKPIEECYNARGLLIDMEEGVVKEICRSPLKNLFPTNQILTDVSGSGNNWAKGNVFYGKYHKNKIEELIRREAESCDCLNSFLFTFSMGGGTGSGLGTAVLEYVATMYPSVPRIAFPVYPSDIDDVITSPYNAVLANNKLSEFAKLIVPFDNQALINICTDIDKTKSKFHLRGKKSLEARVKKTRTSASFSKASLPFDDMNDLIASVISDITSCSRLPGTLNIDINELVTNLTPFGSLKYAVPSSSPFILVPEDTKLSCVFTDLFSPSHALAVCDINKSVVLSYALLARGKLSLPDIQENLNKCTANLKCTDFTQNNRKIGLCNFPPGGRHVSLLKVANTCQMAENLALLKDTFQKMYQKKAHLHHYVDENVSDSEFSHALANLTDVIEEYREINNSSVCIEPPRLNLV